MVQQEPLGATSAIPAIPAHAFRAAVEAASDVIAIADASGMIVFVNEAPATTRGTDPGSLVGTHITALPGFSPDTAHALSLALQAGLHWRSEVCSWQHDGSTTWEYITLTPVNDDHARIQYFALVCHDITDRKTAEERLQQVALYDNLTGLPNRMLLTDRIERALLHLRRTPRNVAVLFLDLDGFRAINDNFGHATGDWLLTSVTRRLHQYLRANDTAARLGGDEFVILLEGLSSRDEVQRIADRIVSAFENPFSIRGTDVQMTVSIGIAMTANSEASAENLLRAADRAMFEAKQAGRDRHHFSEAEIDAEPIHHPSAASGNGSSDTSPVRS